MKITGLTYFMLATIIFSLAGCDDAVKPVSDSSINVPIDSSIVFDTRVGFDTSYQPDQQVGDAASMEDGAVGDAGVGEAIPDDAGVSDAAPDDAGVSDAAADMAILADAAPGDATVTDALPPKQQYGQNCTANADCAAGLLCLAPDDTQPNGFCTRVCTDEGNECQDGTPSGTTAYCLFGVNLNGAPGKVCGFFCKLEAATFSCPDVQDCKVLNPAIDYCYPKPPSS